jgi:predicted Zn-dependent protease with MMP-like domain
MDRESFVELVEEVLDALPMEFHKRIQNLTVLVEDQPAERLSRKIIEGAQKPGSEKTHSVLLGIFQGVPATKRSVFNLSSGPDRIVLYQKNIEAVCSSEGQIRRQVRQTVLHELGHYFGMDEAQLRDVEADI